MVYIPKRVIFEQDALNYPLGKQLLNQFEHENIKTSILKSHNRVSGIPGNTPQESYAEGKSTLVVGVRKTLNFQSCKPSAHYQLPLVTSCAGKCEYCYLNTQLGKKPYIRIYVNIEEILSAAKKYINERAPEVTIFEGAATSDPIVVEHYTHSLYETITFFGKEDLGYFRFVTKFTDIEPILDAKHNGKTTVRFSINAQNIIKKYEHATPSLDERINAVYKVINAAYPAGFIIAPVFLYNGWEDDYLEMLRKLKETLGSYSKKNLFFEVISHRYTERAKTNILSIFPNSELPMDKENRKFKYGQFGYGKYIYTEDQLKNMERFFRKNILELFPNSEIKYII